MYQPRSQSGDHYNLKENIRLLKRASHKSMGRNSFRPIPTSLSASNVRSVTDRVSRSSGDSAYKHSIDSTDLDDISGFQSKSSYSDDGMVRLWSVCWIPAGIAVCLSQNITKDLPRGDGIDWNPTRDSTSCSQELGRSFLWKTEGCRVWNWEYCSSDARTTWLEELPLGCGRYWANTENYQCSQ